MKRRAIRLTDFLAAGMAAYLILHMIPARAFWFDPGVPYVADGTTDRPPIISFDRQIKREALMSYQVVIRKEPASVVVCDPSTTGFPYRPGAELPDDPDLVWWTGGDDRCWPLAPGGYVMETCWAVLEPFWGLLPPKRVCRGSPAFFITEPKEGG